MASIMIQPLKIDNPDGTSTHYLGFQFTTDSTTFTQLVTFESVEAAESLAEGIKKNILAASDELMRDQLGLVIAKTLPEGK